MTGRPRLLVLNQYYAPAYEATGQLLAALCEDLAATFDVTVVTGGVRAEGEATAGRHVRNGVAVIRVRSTSYERKRLTLRALNYLTYLVRSVQAALATPRPDVVLCMTDPPIVANVALLVARRFRAPLVVISQDVFPETAVELGRLENKVVVAALRAAINFYVRRADRIVAIGARMRERLIAKGAEPSRVTVIPNWTDTSVLEPQPHDNAWSRSQGLAGKFVVMHSGNIGHAQDLDSLVRAATLLRDLEDVTILIVGGGARLDELSGLARRLDAGAIRFLPYQDRAVLSRSLSAAHVHVVGLASGLAGYVVPSRVYGIMAVGRPLIVAADDDSETATIVREAECGVVVPPARPELLAAAIRAARAGELDLETMGRRAREYAVAEADRKVATARYRDLLSRLLDDRAYD